jgi:membrane-associated phospholipid phosphatase
MKNDLRLLRNLVLIVVLAAEGVFAQSPYELETRQEIALLGTGLALELFGLYLNSIMPVLTPEQIENLSPENVNPFDRGTSANWSPKADKASDYLLNASRVWPVTLFLSGKIRGDTFKILALYVETVLCMAGPTLTTKGAVRRIRPFVYNNDLPLDQKTTKFARRSFYSGHTVEAFSSVVFTARVLSDYYPKSDYKNLVWGAALLHAGIVGYLRHAAGKHFPTDIITGAIVGSFVGYIIPEIHKKEAKAAGEPIPDFALSFSFQL